MIKVGFIVIIDFCLMRIICPEHNGSIEVSDKDIAQAFNTPAKAIVFNCPVCEEEVLIRNIDADITAKNPVKNTRSEKG